MCSWVWLDWFARHLRSVWLSRSRWWVFWMCACTFFVGVGRPSIANRTSTTTLIKCRSLWRAGCETCVHGTTSSPWLHDEKSVLFLLTYLWPLLLGSQLMCVRTISWNVCLKLTHCISWEDAAFLETLMKSLGFSFLCSQSWRSLQYACLLFFLGLGAEGE